MLRNGWESEPDYQGDFGKMGGHVALVLMRIRMTPPVAWIFPLWDDVWEASPSYLGSKGKFTKRKDGGAMANDIVGEGDPWHHPLCSEENSIFSRHYCTPILARRFSMGKGLEAADVAPTWKAPYTIVLTSPTAVKVPGITPWIHHTRLKMQWRKRDTGLTILTRKNHWPDSSSINDWIQDGAASDDSAVPDCHDNPARTASSG